MDRQIRRLALAILGLFVILFIQVNYIQVFAADELANDPHNKRLLIMEYETDRGDILARDAKTVLAKSVKSRGELKYLRRYPEDGPLYAGITGFYSLVYGRTELEQTYNDFLSGRADELIASSLVDQILGRPKRGASVITTIDPVLQELAAEQLAGRAGAVVAIDPLTGEILAMVANPSFDPNPLALHDTKQVRAAWDRYLNDPDDPMISHANDEIHNPGSNFKMVTAAAALENGFGPESTWDNPDVLVLPQTTAVITNAGGEPCPGGDQITMAVAFQYSCNTIFGEIGLELGPEALHEQAEKFGFNTNTGLDVPSYAPGQFPSVESFEDQAPAVAYSAIGMRDVKGNPLQMAMVAAAIANDGTLMVPHFMREIRDPQGLVVKRYEPHVFGQAISSQTAATLTEMMIAVVEQGTGTAAQVPGYQVAGKTGTAQLDPDLPPHVWFTGFAPADNPALVVSVMLLDGGGAGVDATGGRVAAPIAQALLAEYLSRATG